jgi:hypothetical protein
MLAHSPPLPLVIDYFHEDRDIIAEEEEIFVALEQRDRIRRVRLNLPFPNLQNLIMAIDEEYPVLEYLIMAHSSEDSSTALMFPDTFQAPHLRHVMLLGFALPIGSRSLTTVVGMVTLSLSMYHPFQPDTLLQWISFMPQLETLLILSDNNCDMERQLLHAPIVTHVTLPNLRFIEFQGGIAYMEAIICQITTPRLQKLVIHLPWQFTLSVPPLLQFIKATESLRFDSAKVVLAGDDEVYVEVYPLEEAETYALSIHVYCRQLDWQVSSVARIINSLSQISSTVEHLTLKHKVNSRLSEEYDMVDCTVWHELLRSFGNVKTLHVDDGLVKELSRGLRLDDGELPLELLLELQELTYSGSGNADAFTSFIEARQNAGRPVTLIRHS